MWQLNQCYIALIFKKICQCATCSLASNDQLTVCVPLLLDYCVNKTGNTVYSKHSPAKIHLNLGLNSTVNSEEGNCFI